MKLGTAVVVIAVWELVCRMGLVNSIVLAPPSDIVLAVVEDWRDFMGAFRVTVLSILTAGAIAWCVGIGFGIVAGLSPLGYGVFRPMLMGLFAIPLITMYPMFLVWFGIGPASKIAFASLIGTIPIALNTMDGVRLVDRSYISLARSIGASRLQAYLRIYFPLSLPSILSGLRLGTSLVVIGVVVCEMLASIDGLGFWISYNRTLFKTGHVYLGIALALTTVVLVNLALSYIEKKFGSSPDEGRSQA